MHVFKKINDPALTAILNKQAEIEQAFERKAKEEGRTNMVRRSSPSKKRKDKESYDLPVAMLKRIDALVERQVRQQIPMNHLEI